MRSTTAKAIDRSNMLAPCMFILFKTCISTGGMSGRAGLTIYLWALVSYGGFFGLAVNGGLVLHTFGHGDADVHGGAGVSGGSLGGIDGQESGVGGDEAVFHGEAANLLGELGVFFPDGALHDAADFGACPEGGECG